MAWIPRNYMSEIRRFLLSFPALETFEPKENLTDDRLTIEYFKTTPQNIVNPEGYAMAVVGTNILNRYADISGNVILRKRANFQLLMRLYTQTNEQRRDIGDFILNFQDWINFENEIKLNPYLPHFSDTNYEQIICDGGMTLSVDVEPKQKGAIDEFLLQIHLEWENVYKNYENNANNITNDFYYQLFYT